MKQKEYIYRSTKEKERERLYLAEESFILGRPLPTTNYLSIFVWNIYKQQRLDWLTLLKEEESKHDLMLLQEAQSTPPLIKFAREYYEVADHVPAIEMPNLASGVMTLATTLPIYTRSFQQKEPLLRLSKSALITLYPLYDGRLLMVINVHAVNFSLGVEAYETQIKTIANHVMLHDGPMIFAGDFNTWSRPRLYLLYRFARQMGLRPVTFKQDRRTAVFNLPLDFIFYRELTLLESAVIETNASDHNPLTARFQL